MTLQSFYSVPPDESQSLLVGVDHDDDTATVRITVSGEVDGVTSGELHDLIIDVLRRHRPSTVEMNTAGVAFLDSAGIRTLVLCQADARQVGCHIVLVDTPLIVRRVLEITGLLEHFGLTENDGARGPTRS